MTYAVTPAVPIRHVQGNLLEQPIETLVNAWNRNYMPRWLLVPHGVSGGLKKRTGPGPLARPAPSRAPAARRRGRHRRRPTWTAPTT